MYEASTAARHLFCTSQEHACLHVTCMPARNVRNSWHASARERRETHHMETGLSLVFLDALRHLVALLRSLRVASEMRSMAHQCLRTLACRTLSDQSWREVHSAFMAQLAKY